MVGAAVTFGLESANIVGYQTKTLDAGFSLSTPTFLDVGQTSMDLQNFKLGPNAAGDGTEMIQFLNDEGQCPEMWIWLNANMGMDEGWYDFNTWEPITKTIVPAVGYLMNVSASVDMLVAGQVKTDKTTVTIPTGFSVFGNNTPVDVDIQSIKLGEAALGDGTEMIQFLNNEGQCTEMWIWLNANMGMEEGWYDFNTWQPIEYTVKAGEAFLMNVTAPVEMTIPSAL
jgi:hypothetical protein